jgi:AmpD protein
VNPATTFPISEDGRAAGARFVPSPNCDARPEGTPVELVVIHNISLPPREFGGPHIEDLFLNRLAADAHPYFADVAALRVSAHFLIRRDGELLQFVPCTLRAWHAGVSSWRGRERCNDFSVGIELEGADDLPYEPAQYACLRALLAGLCARYPIQEVVGHSDVAPVRKTDPGPAFVWGEIKNIIKSNS